MPHLLQAVLDHLRASLALDESTSEVMPTGKPPAFSGDTFYVVHPGQIGTDQVEGLEETFGVDVTITLRTGSVPADRVGTELILNTTTGIYARAAAVRAKLHMRYADVMNDANAALGSGVNGFVEPLWFLGAGRVQEQGAAWFSAKATTANPAGISLTLSFGRARRIQVIEEMT